mmetsp:Transcript_2727/g.11031  ORF Transcript_2727/g.11031 Transcript_2727/m.11031 type:complete len:490 (+) Transcript_2727:379-1848(+)
MPAKGASATRYRNAQPPAKARGSPMESVLSHPKANWAVLDRSNGLGLLSTDARGGTRSRITCSAAGVAVQPLEPPQQRASTSQVSQVSEGVRCSEAANVPWGARPEVVRALAQRLQPLLKPDEALSRGGHENARQDAKAAASAVGLVSVQAPPSTRHWTADMRAATSSSDDGRSNAGLAVTASRSVRAGSLWPELPAPKLQTTCGVRESTLRVVKSPRVEGSANAASGGDSSPLAPGATTYTGNTAALPLPQLSSRATSTHCLVDWGEMPGMAMSARAKPPPGGPTQRPCAKAAAAVSLPAESTRREPASARLVPCDGNTYTAPVPEMASTWAVTSRTTTRVAPASPVAVGTSRSDGCPAAGKPAWKPRLAVTPSTTSRMGTAAVCTMRSGSLANAKEGAGLGATPNRAATVDAGPPRWISSSSMPKGVSAAAQVSPSSPHTSLLEADRSRLARLAPRPSSAPPPCARPVSFTWARRRLVASGSSALEG